MKLIAFLFIFASFAAAQAKPNAAIQQELRSLGSGQIEVNFDAVSKVTTIRAVADNFANSRRSARV